MQTERTKGKVRENLGLLKTYLEKEYGCPVSEDTERILFNALDWTADDVQNQSFVTAPQLHILVRELYQLACGHSPEFVRGGEEVVEAMEAKLAALPSEEETKEKE